MNWFFALTFSITLVVLFGTLWPMLHKTRTSVIALVLFISLTTISIYRFAVGTPMALQPGAAIAQQANNAQSLDEAATTLAAELERRPDQIEGWLLLAHTYQSLGKQEQSAAAYTRAEDALAILIESLQTNPEQPQGWLTLARAHVAMDKKQEAAQAYTQVLKLVPDEPQILTEAAEARARSNPAQHFDEQAVAWLQQAIQLAPEATQPRLLLGISQRQNNQPAEAAKTWEPLLAKANTPEVRASMLQQINSARVEAGLNALPADYNGSASDTNDATSAVATIEPTLVNVHISLADELQSQLSPAAILFVYARQADGSPMPVAAKRIATPTLPLDLSFSDKDSLMPTIKLSQLNQAMLIARISINGIAERSPGDFESQPQTVTLDAQTPNTINLLINQIVK